jgi:phosphatidylserine/phosphatidylglycerophosphate/cardiolipin synthase-like enzyme
MVERWLANLSAAERERLILYLLVGSHNQNYRSMAMDGEAAFLVSGTSINAGLIDLVSITGQTEWVETVEEMSALLPRPARWELGLTRWLRIIL